MLRNAASMLAALLGVSLFVPVGCKLPNGHADLDTNESSPDWANSCFNPWAASGWPAHPY